jgi:hypothetical protein
MLVTLSGLYVFGALSGQYSYGRVIAFMVLLVHIIMAERLAIYEARVHETHAASWLQRLSVPASVTVLVLLLSLWSLGRTLVQALLAPPPTYEPYLFLSRFSGQYDVVLSDIQSSWIVPTFGGKIIATLHPLAFVPDDAMRRADLDRFFNAHTALSERLQIIQKYTASYVLLKKSDDVSWQLQQAFVPHGRVVFESDSFVLIGLKLNPGKDALQQ